MEHPRPLLHLLERAPAGEVVCTGGTRALVPDLPEAAAKEGGLHRLAGPPEGPGFYTGAPEEQVTEQVPTPPRAAAAVEAAETPRPGAVEPSSAS